MANHKSAIKRHKQSQVRRMRNRINKSKMSTAIRRVEEALVAGAEDAAQEALKIAIPAVC
ncbi:MAG: 30S ribosomal protein S20 [Candidatus Electrothrix sp. AUS1_2]|nr:30S ribosomal protein S20 [Candidatus Electrothrix sp. AUS1_2]